MSYFLFSSRDYHEKSTTDGQRCYKFQIGTFVFVAVKSFLLNAMNNLYESLWTDEDYRIGITNLSDLLGYQIGNIKRILFLH